MYLLSYNFSDWTDFNTSFTTLPAILTFLPNETSKTFSVWSEQDNITEDMECLYLSLQPVEEHVITPYDNNTVTVCIENDDGKPKFSRCIIFVD